MLASDEERLPVLVVLADAVRQRHLAASLAELGGIIAVSWDDIESGDHAEVAVIDDAATVKNLPPGTPVVLLSGHDGETATRGLAAAMLRADADPVLIAAAARLAAAGYRITEGASGASAGLPNEAGSDSDEREANLPIQLSRREADVLALLAEGAPNKMIARRLDISIHTVKFHVAAILVKLGAANRTDAIATAMRLGLVLV